MRRGARLFFWMFLLCASPAWAQAPVFLWPNAYTITLREVNKQTGSFTVTTYFRDGLHVRNQMAKPNNESEVRIYRMEEFKQIYIAMDGSVHESKIAQDWQLPSIFPINGNWELMGEDTVHGVGALKYRVSFEALQLDSAKPAPYFTLWLTTDHKTPLKLEEGDRLVEFVDYKVGPQDPKLFEAPLKK